MQAGEDDQVKIRGYRIELGEIEGALKECAGIRESVVISRKDVQGEAQLYAYYLSDEPRSAQELRSALSSRLPEYMIPHHYRKIILFH